MSAAAAVWRGRLFGPGCAGGGSDATLRWQGESLEVAGPGVALSVPARALSLETAGFNGTRLQVGWSTPEGEYAFFLDQSRDGFLDAAPPGLADCAATARRRQRGIARRFRAALLGYALVLLLPLVALGLFLMQSDRVAAWAIQHVPRGVEERLGELTLAQTRARVALHEDGAAQEAVRRLGAVLSAGSSYRWRWFVAVDPAVNAYAAPGGVVVVNTGLLRAVHGPGELAGVLAHEIAHVERRHALRGVVKSAGLGVLLSLALGDWSGSAAGVWAGRLANLKFSRDVEMEADALAVRTLYEAGLSPQPMAAFFGRLAEDEARMPGLSLLSSHPPSAERMSALQARIARLPPKTYREPDVDWPAVRAWLPPAQQPR